MKITESQLNNIITESIQKTVAEYQLKEHIKKLVRESLYEIGGFSQFEGESEESEENDNDRRHDRGEDGRVSDENHENAKQQNVRKNVIAFFKREGVDHAPYAYKLYGVDAEEGKDTNEMKNARGKFEKCLNGEPNENGYPYSFTSAEINRLKSMTSDDQL